MVNDRSVEGGAGGKRENGKSCEKKFKVRTPFVVVLLLLFLAVVSGNLLWHHLGCGGGGGLDGQTEYAHDAVHGLVLPSDSAAAIGGVVPEAGASRVEARAVLLHDDACDNVFEGFRELRQRVQALLDHIGRPLVYFRLNVQVAADRALDAIFDDIAHFIDDECGVLGVIFHWPLIARFLFFATV